MSNTVTINPTAHGVPAPFGFVRNDPSLHHELGFRQRQTEPPRAPPPEPTEAELRAALAAAVEAHRTAEQVLSDATEAHQRAERRRQVCSRRLAAFVDLDHRMSAATIEALRNDGDVDAVHQQFAAETAERARAMVESSTADGAANALMIEMAQASQRVGDLVRTVDIAAIKVLACVGDELALQHAQLVAQCHAIAAALTGLDRIAGPTRTALSARVHRALRDVAGNAALRANPDLSAWMAGMQALKADPQAAIEIALPEAKIEELPQPQPFAYGVTIVKPLAVPPPQPQPAEETAA
jgi:hypothetical protein